MRTVNYIDCPFRIINKVMYVVLLYGVEVYRFEHYLDALYYCLDWRAKHKGFEKSIKMIIEYA